MSWLRDAVDGLTGAIQAAANQATALADQAAVLGQDINKPLVSAAAPAIHLLGNVPVVGAPVATAISKIPTAPTFANLSDLATGAPVAAIARPAFATLTDAASTVTAAAAPTFASLSDLPDAASTAYNQVNSPAGGRIFAAVLPAYAAITPTGRQGLEEDYLPAIQAAASIYGGPAAGQAVGAGVQVAQSGSVSAAVPVAATAAATYAGADPNQAAQAAALANAAASGNTTAVQIAAINSGAAIAGQEAGVSVDITSQAAAAATAALNSDAATIQAMVQAEVQAELQAQAQPALATGAAALQAAQNQMANMTPEQIQAAALGVEGAIPTPAVDIITAASGTGFPVPTHTGSASPATVVTGAAAAMIAAESAVSAPSLADQLAAPAPPQPAPATAPRAAPPAADPASMYATYEANAGSMSFEELQAAAEALDSHGSQPVDLSNPNMPPNTLQQGFPGNASAPPANPPAQTVSPAPAALPATTGGQKWVPSPLVIGIGVVASLGLLYVIFKKG